MRWLIYLLLLISTGAFAGTITMNDPDTVLAEMSGRETFKFFFVGHAYGAHKGRPYWQRHRVAYPHPGLILNVERLKKHDFGVFGGDVVEACNDQTIAAFEEILLKQLGMPVFNATGNHDQCLPSRYGYPHRIAFNLGKQLFLVLSSAETSLTTTDQTWLRDELKAAKRDSSLRRIFLFTHRPVFLQLAAALDSLRGQANIFVSLDPEFRLEFGELLLHLGPEKELYWFAGDMGVRKELIYHKLNDNVHLIASGLYERPEDHFLTIGVSADSVDITLNNLQNTASTSLQSYTSGRIAAAADDPQSTGDKLNEMITRLHLAVGLKGGQKLDSELIDGDVTQAFGLYYKASRNALIFRRYGCKGEGKLQFFIQFFPRHKDDLMRFPRPWNGHHFNAHRVGRDGNICVADIDLPEYPLSHIQTGQLDDGRRIVWQLKTALPNDAVAEN